MTFRQCAAPVVVIATILGAVELLRKPVAAMAGRWSCVQAWLRQRTMSPRQRPENSRPWELVSLATRD